MNTKFKLLGIRQIKYFWVEKTICNKKIEVKLGTQEVYKIRSTKNTVSIKHEPIYNKYN